MPDVRPKGIEMTHSHLLITCSLLMALTPADEQAEDVRSLDSIRWILGDWMQKGPQTTARETWSALHADVFQGKGLTTNSVSGKKLGSESLLLAEMSGAVYYFAKVKQNKYPIPFQLTPCSKKHAIFENPGHDFPKKLEYRLVAKDALDVKVSDGGTQSFTIHFKRRPKSAPK